MDPDAQQAQNHHSPERRLIELRIEHADLDSLIDRAAEQSPVDELALRRLKKRRLVLRDMIARLEGELDPPEPA
ncbi:MAG: YdcH family protein [Aquabacterium sp.]|nr:YdcH family protein [Aquabacterium sp.]